MSKIHVIHENSAWTQPLLDRLSHHDLPYESWDLSEGTIVPAEIPPDGVFYSRMSASAHTRGHTFAPELARDVLFWLERHGRRVVNSHRALCLEISKLSQYAALEASGIATPRTIGAVGSAAVREAARRLDMVPFILKPNRGGTGAGVRKIHSLAELESVLNDPSTEAPLDGTWLVQQYVAAPEPLITRCEFIGGRFLYAVKVDTSEGFDLCPADICVRPEGREKFTIDTAFRHPIIGRIEDFLAANGIEVAGVEIIEDREGRVYAYDVNTNTNYNRRAEDIADVSGMDTLARFLGRELTR